MIGKALQLLLNDDIEKIHLASLRVLEEIGVEIDNENVLKILSEAGANVDYEDKLAHIPETLVRESLQKTPSEVKLYSLDGKYSLLLGKERVHFSPGSTASYVLDRETMAMRHPLSRDFADFVRLTDKLKHIHLQSTAMVISDVPDSVADRLRLYWILKNSTKPVISGAFTIDGVYDMKKMLEIVLGDKSSLEKKPPMLMDVCPSPPLKWSKVTSQNLIDLAKFNIPTEIVPAPQLGSTAPVTLAGLLVQHNAEFLSGLVISQLVNPGICLVYGGSPSLMDMRYGTGCVGSIEVDMLSIAYSQIAKSYNIPSGAYLGTSETKSIDAQTGIESAIGIIMGTLAGINSITGAGMLAFENCQSFEKLIIDNEICGMALRLARGITVDRETVAFELMKKVGPGGSFLQEKHTLKWLQTEEYIPSPIFDKTGRTSWEKSETKDIVERARKTVDKTLEEHHPKPLPSDIEKELDSFAKKILKHATNAS